MLSQEVVPAFFKIQTKHLGLSTLIVNTKCISYLPSKESCHVTLDLKLSIANKHLVLNSVLFLNGDNSKSQLQLLEDEILCCDGVFDSDCVEIEDHYLGRTDQQIDEIEKAMLHAESKSGDDFFVLGGVTNHIEVPFMTLDEAFQQPIFLDSAWQDIYNLNYKITDNHADSACETKELYFKIERILNEWILKQLKLS